MQLQRLDEAGFTALTADEARAVLGGLADAAGSSPTFYCYCLLGGTWMPDYTVDSDTVQPVLV
jgi:hypothetical protein